MSAFLRVFALGFGMAMALGGCGGSDDLDDLSGAELVGGGGEVAPEDAMSDPDVALEDLDMSDAAHLVSDGDGGMWIVFGDVGFGARGGTLLHIRGGRIDGARSLSTSPDDGFPTTTAAPAIDGDVVLADSASGGQPTIWVVGLGEGEDRGIEGPPARHVTGAAMTDDGTVLVSDYEHGKIVGLSADGAAADVVTLHPESLSAGKEPDWRPLDVVALPENRVAYVEESGRFRNVQLHGPGVSDRWQMSSGEDDAIATIAPTDDGRLVVVRGRTTIGSRTPLPRDGQRVELVDPDDPDGIFSSGDERVVLDDYDKTLSSVAAIGDDLYLLYDNRLWTVEGALDE